MLLGCMKVIHVVEYERQIDFLTGTPQVFRTLSLLDYIQGGARPSVANAILCFSPKSTSAAVISEISGIATDVGLTNKCTFPFSHLLRDAKLNIAHFIGHTHENFWKENVLNAKIAHYQALPGVAPPPAIAGKEKRIELSCRHQRLFHFTS